MIKTDSSAGKKCSEYLRCCVGQKDGIVYADKNIPRRILVIPSEAKDL